MPWIEGLGNLRHRFVELLGFGSFAGHDTGPDMHARNIVFAQALAFAPGAKAAECCRIDICYRGSSSNPACRRRLLLHRFLSFGFAVKPAGCRLTHDIGSSPAPPRPLRGAINQRSQEENWTEDLHDRQERNGLDAFEHGLSPLKTTPGAELGSSITRRHGRLVPAIHVPLRKKVVD